MFFKGCLHSFFQFESMIYSFFVFYVYLGPFVISAVIYIFALMCLIVIRSPKHLVVFSL